MVLHLNRQERQRRETRATEERDGEQKLRMENDRIGEWR